MWQYRRLQQFAIATSVFSVIYNAAEGVISIIFASEADSISLLFFGIDSFVEVVSSCVLVWRFAKISPPGEERSIMSTDIIKERRSTLVIGCLFGILALGTWAGAMQGLNLHSHPTTTLSQLIISASALLIMIMLWFLK